MNNSRRCSKLARALKASKIFTALRNTRFYMRVRNRRKTRKRQQFFRQGTTSLRVGAFTIALPAQHPLIRMQTTQPYRDQHVGVCAGVFGMKYPHAAVIDIGANVGDTAARMASNCGNDLILIEPSEFYLSYLEKNAALFPNKTVIENVMIGGEEMARGNLVHWGGTAYFEPTEATEAKRFVTKQLSDFRSEVCFVKCDTDGNDFAIVNRNLSWLSTFRPGLNLEVQIRTNQDLSEANRAFRNLWSIGYRYFLFFDDPGFMLLGTNNLEQVIELNRYQFKLYEHGESVKSIANFDVLCCHERDLDAFRNVRDYYSIY